MTGTDGHRKACFEAKQYQSLRHICKKRFLPILLLLSATATPILVSSAYAVEEPVSVPYVKSSQVVVDAVISKGEYAGSYVDPPTSITVYWEHDSKNIYVGLFSKGTGWVAIGFGPKNTGMDGANIIIGYVDNSSALIISDQIGVGFEHYPDTIRGGTDNILASAGSQKGGGTTIEFVFPLNSGDVNDQAFREGGTYGFILAYDKSAKDLATYHTARSNRLTLSIKDSKAAPSEEPGAKEPKQEVKPKSTSLNLSLPTEPMANGKAPISAKLFDVDGVAVTSSIVNFYLNTTFGEVKVGSSITNRDGVAKINITRKIDGILAVRAEYTGDIGYNASGKVGYVAVKGAHVLENDPIYWVFSFTQSIIAIVLGSVFSVYAFVLYQVSKIRTDRGAS